MGKEITVGRDRSCDIVVDTQYNNVSRKHAIIRKEGGRLILEDTSLNGTYINQRKVNRTRTEIRQDDDIRLAKDYLLNWSHIIAFFPVDQPVVRDYSARNTERYTQQWRETPPAPVVPAVAENPYRREPQREQEVSREVMEAELRKWNWGAFVLYPLWGFANGMWWLILVSMFLGWTFPIINIIMGVKGSRWAWENKQWRDFYHFRQVQEAWKPWGIGILILNLITIFLFIILLITGVGMMSSLFMY